MWYNLVSVWNYDKRFSRFHFAGLLQQEVEKDINKEIESFSGLESSTGVE